MLVRRIKWTVAAAGVAVAGFAASSAALGQTGAGQPQQVGQAQAPAGNDPAFVENAPPGFIPGSEVVDDAAPAGGPALNAPAPSDGQAPPAPGVAAEAPQGVLPNDAGLPPAPGPMGPEGVAPGGEVAPGLPLTGEAQQLPNSPEALVPPPVGGPGAEIGGPGGIEAAVPPPVVWHRFVYTERCFYGEFRSELLLYSDGTFLLIPPAYDCGYEPSPLTGWWHVRGEWLTFEFEDRFVDYGHIAGGPGQWGLYFDGGYWHGEVAFDGGPAAPIR